MNNDILKGQWRQIRGNVRSAFGQLTDDDMETINGDSEAMLGKLQERYGYTREQASDAWNRFTRDLGDMFNQNDTMGGSGRDMGR